MRRLWWLIRTAWRMGRAARLPRPLPIVLIITLVHRWSKDQDVYFGSLARHLPASLTFALCETGVRCPADMVPVEWIWTWTDLWRYWQVSGLAKQSSDNVLCSFFYICGTAIARRSFTDIRVLYPCEARPWEAALVRGLRTRVLHIFGYIHSMMKSLDGSLPEKDSQPHLWLVTGCSAKTWLIERGGYPADHLVVLGTLRDTKRLEGHLLIAFAGWTPAYDVQVQQAFALLTAWPDRTSWKIRIRTHPSTALPCQPSFPYERSTGTLEEDFAWADRIGVIPSQVGVLAYESGKPVMELVPWDFLKGGDPVWIHGIRQPMTEENYHLIEQI